MLRSTLAALGGYFAIALLIMVTFTLAYSLMGTERAFRPASFEVSGLWIVTSIALSFGSALIGGWLSGRIDPSPRSRNILLGLILILGVVTALASPSGGPVDGDRPVDLGRFDAMDQARQPAWVAWLNPLIGMAAVWIARRR